MIKRKLVIIIVTGVVLFVAGSVFAYYRFVIPKNEKKIVLASRITTTPTKIPSSTPTASPSATPTPIIKYIYYPTASPVPDIKQVLNDYDACKEACPLVGEGVTCTENTENNDQPQTSNCETIEGSDGEKTTVKCTMGSSGSSSRTTCKRNKHPDEACINSCKSKYGLNF